MKKVLVTGGAGFLGSNLCKKLSNVQIFCVDNLFTGIRQNIHNLENKANFNFIFHDVNKYLHLEVDEIYHLACPASPVHYQQNPIQTAKTGFLGTLNALELARNTGSKVLIASTSEVYGDPAEHPQSEEYWGNVNPIGPRACYDESKRCAETLASDYRRQYGVDSKIVRIFNTYGPQMTLNDGRVITNFILQALQNKEITIYGDGNQTRSFCYVDDLIDGLIKFMNSDFSGPLNLGNPTEYSMIDVAKTIIDLTESKSKLTFVELPKDDPKRRKPDISKAREILGWEPKISLSDGLKHTIFDIKSKLENFNA